MPSLVPTRLAAACALALTAVLVAAAPATAKGPSVSLRVVGAHQKVLSERTIDAHTTSVKASPKADCFGSGTGGNGKSVKIQGATALGVLVQAAQAAAGLRPLLITDAFDFGLGICGVGGSEATSKLSWYLKVNHVNPEVGGESVKLHRGDEVLWALAAYPYPEELSLVAPAHVVAGRPFEVRVFAYDDKGRKHPAAGVRVTGARYKTGADGRAGVVLNKPTNLIAVDSKDIPSPPRVVCVQMSGAEACP